MMPKQKNDYHDTNEQGDPTRPSSRRSVLGVHWKDWCWSWNSNTLATWSEELTHLKRPWCWEKLRAGGEGDDRGWDGWMASPTRWTWVWVNSRSWWWTGRPGVLRFMGSQRVGHYWATELNWNHNARYYIWPLAGLQLFISNYSDTDQLKKHMICFSYKVLNSNNVPIPWNTLFYSITQSYESPFHSWGNRTS